MATTSSGVGSTPTATLSPGCRRTILIMPRVIQAMVRISRNTDLKSAKPPRSQAAMAYDAVRRETVLFSGSLENYPNDLWEYGPVSPAAC